jgi:hypothetical protein
MTSAPYRLRPVIPNSACANKMQRRAYFEPYVPVIGRDIANALRSRRRSNSWTTPLM